MPAFWSAVRTRWAGLLIGLVLLMNLIDATLTIMVVGAGIAVESNPLLAGLLEAGPVYFIMLKAVLVGGGCFLLWRYRQNELAQIGAYITFVTYWSLVLWFWYGLS